MNRVNEKICRSEKVKFIGGHIKVKWEISQASVMIHLYVKFTVHFTHAKQVSAKSGGRTDTPGDDNRHLPRFWLRPKKSTCGGHFKIQWNHEKITCTFPYSGECDCKD